MLCSSCIHKLRLSAPADKVSCSSFRTRRQEDISWLTAGPKIACLRALPQDSRSMRATPNSSPIVNFGSKPITVHLHGRDFHGNFIVASIIVGIVGTDFLCAHTLLVDVADRCLIDAVSLRPCGDFHLRNKVTTHDR